MLKRFFCVLIASLLTISLMGCGEKLPEITAEDVTLYPVTVSGISFEQSPKKVVSLCTAITDIMIELSYSDRLVGVSSDCQMPEGATMQVVGTAQAPDIDAIIALAPELLITQEPLLLKDTNRLAESKIKVMVLPTPTNLYQIEAQFQTIGGLFGGIVPERYQDIQNADGSPIASGKSKASNITDAYIASLTDMAKRSVSEQAKSFLLVLSSDGGKVATGKTIEGNLVGIVGKNIAQKANNYAIDPVAIIEQDPEYIIVPNGQMDSIMQNESYKSLTAVQNNKVIEIDVAPLYTQSPAKIYQELKNLCDKLYKP